jgi:WD40 repeat protein
MDGTIRLVSTVDGREVDSAKIAESSPQRIAFLPDGSRIVVGDDMGRIVVWDRVERRIVAEWTTPQPTRVLALAVGRDGDLIASAAADQVMRMHDVDSLSVVETIPASSNVNAVGFSSDGRRVAWGGDFGGLFACEPGIWTDAQAIPTRSACLCIAFANSSSLIASGHSNGNLQITDASSGRLLHRRSSSAHVKSLAWSPDDRLLVSTHYDGTLRVWHAPTATELGVLYRSGIMFSTARFSPDGKWLAAIFSLNDASQGILWKLDE